MEEKYLQRVMVAGKIRDYIDSHLGDNHLEDEFSLDKIARELNYSKFYMERVFSEVTGTTIYKYIRERRLARAAEQLVETNRTVLDIAFEAGYASPQAFTMAFRSLYMCPPKVYRKNKRIVLRRNNFDMCKKSVLYRPFASRTRLSSNLSLHRLWKGRVAA